jgi:hypothetical protein
MKLQIFKTEDWEALYIDGILWGQGHKFSREELAKIAGWDLDIAWDDGELGGPDGIYPTELPEEFL